MHSYGFALAITFLLNNNDVTLGFSNVNLQRIPSLSLQQFISSSSSSLLEAKKGGGFAKKSGGFGTTTTKTKTKTKKKTSTPTYTLNKGPSIQSYLNPNLFTNPSTLQTIKDRIRNGDICVIRNAFIPELAEAMYTELDTTDTWSLNEDYFEDGYGFRHNNVYSKNDCSHLFLSVNDMFESPETKSFMADLTGRDCSGDIVGAPSYYEVGHHSLPHTDHIGQRSVAYIWHMSKDWRAEYGGGLYWCKEPLANAYLHASFNSLVLFSVTPHSSHFVTTVSPRAQGKGKRLAYNGWWHSSWVPKTTDPLETLLDTPEKRLTLTHAQVCAIQDMLDDPWAPRIQPPERHEEIVALRGKIMEELYPVRRSPPVDVL
uniref:Prolyl 3,4-dihydroxylase TPA1/OFD1 N-terminal domain-containing protein n=1 Tax=Ditylum brightwellii TaxID=49249 RepID=A0A7S1ZCJ8_9STRA|mmetsp:Transcript_29168/g.43356  ORF Transcript_29168/g.43356 Transcript_29168/m.43356 type:complete len:372 (+) Transcript_29168:106-1221(+)